MNLQINPQDVLQSFNQIASDLMFRHALAVNNHLLEFTEIEFYYFNKQTHPDEYTHPHKMPEGLWRFHRQGLDLTLAGNFQDIDGGILIRGIKHGNDYINGPVKVVSRIFELMGPVGNLSTLQLKAHPSPPGSLLRCPRRFTGNKNIHQEFHQKPYRYFKNFKQEMVSKKDMQSIIKGEQVIVHFHPPEGAS